MLTKQLSILNRIRSKDRFKILTCATHESWQTMLDKTGHQFYMLSGDGLKGWDTQTRPIPPNHYMFQQPYNKIGNDISYDMVLCQNRAQQFPILQNIAERLGIPMISVNHTEPPPGIKPKQLAILKQWRCDVEVFITTHNKQSWGGHLEDIVIPHGIDTELFKGYTGEIPSGISVVNLFPQRDVFCGWSLWKKITEKIPVDLVGENPGLSQSISDTGQLASTLAKHRFFLNTSQLSPIPLSLLEAASVGLPIISTAKQEIPKIFTHGVNALLSNEPEELIEFCTQLLSDPEKAAWLGANSRKLIVENYNIDLFVERWDKVFRDTYEKAR